MDWDRIAKSWMQFVAPALPPRRPAAKMSQFREDSNGAAPSLARAYEDERMTPYVPDARDERHSFSQHLGC
jgi:hypothetical protein